MAGQQIVSIDNIEHPLESMMLCQALTQTRLSIRVLGFSKIVDTPVDAAFYATGNQWQPADV